LPRDTNVVVGSTELAAGTPAASDSLSAISAIGARKYFGVTRALDGCNFSARLGEIHAIVGGNGCGKSTLAKVISGVLPLDGGQVQVLGRTPTSPSEARDLGIATVFQEVLVADECSIVDNIFLGADNLFSARFSTREKTRAAAALMRDLTGEAIDVHDLVGTLPLGVRQWITIARALVISPKVLILDESSAALDFDSTERLFARMRELRDRGSAVLIVTHRIAELIRISDRATVMRDGRDVGVLEKSEITERNLLSMMTGHTASKAESRSADFEVLTAPVVLKAENLTLWEGAEPVDFTLHRGEILGVAGLDGQGQSEFVRALAGVSAAVSGAAEVETHEGDSVRIHSIEEAVEHGVVYVSGDRKREGIFANLSIFENMLMPLFRTKSRGGVLGLIDWSGLEGIFAWEAEKLAIRMGDRSDKITSLSGGNQQKVLIARGFAMKPDIIVLNDPARGIDAGAKTELYRHLRDFAASGKSVVYMSSELEEFIGFATRVIVFRHGTVFDEFVGEEIDPTRILEAMFGHTAGLQRRGPRRPADTAVDFAAARRDRQWSRPSGPIDNPLRAPQPQPGSPVRSGNPKPPETIARPRDPEVTNIPIVQFDDDRTQTVEPRNASPFRRPERSP
jgi:ribose transport system ATP-binding protein